MGAVTHPLSGVSSFVVKVLYELWSKLPEEGYTGDSMRDYSIRVIKGDARSLDEFRL